MSDFDVINNLSPFSDEFRRSIVNIGRRAGEAEVLSEGRSYYPASYAVGGSSVFLAQLTDSKRVDGSGTPQRWFYKWEEWPFGGRTSSNAASDGSGTDQYRFGAINAAEIGNPPKPTSGTAYGTYGVSVGQLTSGGSSPGSVELLPVVQTGRPQPVVLMYVTQSGIEVEGVSDKVHFFFNAANAVDVLCGS